MRTLRAVELAAAFAIGLVTATASGVGFEITPAIQAELDRQKAIVATWAANPVVLGAVVSQNRRGPITGMDNAKWKMMRRSDPVEQERGLMLAAFEAPGSDRRQAVEDVLWALVNSKEFLYNH